MMPLCQRPEWSGEAAPAPAAARRCTSGAPAAELPSHLPSLAHPDTFPPCDLASPHYVQVSAEGGWRREGRAAQEDRGQSGGGSDVDKLNISFQVRKYFNKADKNGDGKLTKEEWHQVLNQSGVPTSV